MKHIQKLILHNFQQWKKGEIEFKEGLNVIVGNTESGKSTLFRSIYSILTGKMPEDYIRKGSKCCEVEIHFSDGSIFKRKRSSKENIALCNDKIFERVGKEIPFEYFKQLGQTSINFGTKEISLCSYSQFEPHFFITLSDYDKSKLIGTICGIDIVDKLVDSINKDIRENNSTIKFLEAQISNDTQNKDSKEKDYNLISIKTNHLEQCLKTTQDSFKTLEDVSKTAQELSEVNKMIKHIQEILETLRDSDFDSSKSIELYRLNNLRLKLDEINQQIEVCRSEQKQIVEVDLSSVKTLVKLNRIQKQLQEVNNDIKIYSNVDFTLEDEKKHLETKKSSLLKEYDVCPLCGGIIK